MNKKHSVVTPKKCNLLTKTILLLAFSIGYGKAVYGRELNLMSVSQINSNLN